MSSGPQRRQRVQLVLKSQDGQELRGMQEQLPNIDSVRQEVASVPAIRDAVSTMSDQHTVLLQDPRTGEVLQDPVPRSLMLNTCLHQLFKYSFLIHIDDVPMDILDTVVWALEMLVDVATNCTDAQLVSFGHIVSAENRMNIIQDARAVAQSTLVSNRRLLMRLQAKTKLALFLLKPAVNRPKDAARYLKEVVEHVCSHTPTGQLMTQNNLLMIFAEALTRSGDDDATAELLLEKLAGSSASNIHGLRDLVVTKVYLSRVLRRCGKTDSAQKHEKWLINWFRKNPHMLPDEELRVLLVPTGESTTPILEALGGPAWLESREHTDKTDHRLVKKCRSCSAREPMVQLSVCSKCKKIYYCSTVCQRKNWPHHKDVCKDIVTMNGRIEQLSLIDASAAQLLKDWDAWRNAVDQKPYISALRLREDNDRGRTHLIFEESIHTPKAGQRAKDKFKIVRCAVFRMSDVFTEIERIMRLDPGEGVEYCEGLLREERAQQSHDVNFLVLRFSARVVAHLDVVNYKFGGQIPYSQNWRQDINPDIPPVQLTLREDIRDAEYD